VRAVEAELGEDCRPSIDRLKRRSVLCGCSSLLYRQGWGIIAARGPCSLCGGCTLLLSQPGCAAPDGAAPVLLLPA
jgi:hypothetical protein